MNLDRIKAYVNMKKNQSSNDESQMLSHGLKKDSCEESALNI